MIRLFNAKSYEIPKEDELHLHQGHPYVILSHVWQKKEVIYPDIPQFQTWAATPSDAEAPLWEKSASAAKIVGACRTVLEHYRDEIQHLWLDTVCIDKKNLTELSTALNSMYRWYKQAKICFAYLEDFSREAPSTEVPEFTRSRWFTRGWTLQELVAPQDVIFFDKDWKWIGNKADLEASLTARTKINGDFLLHRRNVSRASISQRMSWFSGRVTTVPEDTAYSLLGIFGVNMPLLYGEGKERAFRRLQEEIMKYSDDQSLFAWTSPTAESQGSGLLAPLPDYFQSTGDYVYNPDRSNNRPFGLTNKGVSIDLFLQKYQGVYVASINVLHGRSHVLGIYLECLNEENQHYRRINTDELCRVVRSGGRGQLRSVFVKPPDDI